MGESRNRYSGGCANSGADGQAGDRVGKCTGDDLAYKEMRNRVLGALLDAQIDQQGEGMTMEELAERLGSWA